MYQFRTDRSTLRMRCHRGRVWSPFIGSHPTRSASSLRQQFGLAGCRVPDVLQRLGALVEGTAVEPGAQSVVANGLEAWRPVGTEARRSEPSGPDGDRAELPPGCRRFVANRMLDHRLHHFCSPHVHRIPVDFLRLVDVVRERVAQNVV